MVEVEELVKKMKSNRAKWGFIWILIASILWGVSYVPKEVIWLVDPLGPLWEAGGATLFEGTIVASALQALFFGIFLVIVWSTVNGKTKEVVRNFRTWGISKWFLVSAVSGGLVAMFGSTVATAYVGADYASAIALLSAVTGTVYGKFFLDEKVTRKGIFGMMILIVGGVLVMDPVNMIDQITNPESKDGLWIGYAAGIFSAIGWGIESCYNVRGLDLADSEATTPVRYLWECILWLFLIMPAVCIFVGWDMTFGILWQCLTSPAMWILTFITVLSLGLADSLLHKGYALMGGGRGLAVNAIYVPVSLVALWFFLKDYDISLWLIVGSVISIIGTFVMYLDLEEYEDINRDLKDNDI